LFNPAIIVRNWGKQKAELRVDGRRIPDGKDLRQGIVSKPDGDDLVLWFRLASDKPTEVSIHGQQ
jgi:hypothetical protein